MARALRRPGLILCLLAPLALPAAAFGDALSPESGGSPKADKIDTLYWIIFILGLIVFVGVMGTLLYSIIKFRARKGAVAAQIRGNTRLEIGWTVGAALILVVLAVVTFVFLPSIENPPNSDANGFQAAHGGLLYATGPEQRPPAKRQSLHVPAQRQVAQRLRQRPAVHLALHLRAELPERAAEQRLLLRGDGRPDRDDGHA